MRRPRVLVFDDDLVHRPDWLAHLEAELVYRPHADAAEDDVAAVRPDLVLMDYAMGSARTGVDAVAALRERWPPGSLVIVGISSDASCNWRMQLAGADHGVVKGGAPEWLAGFLLRGLRP